MGTRLGLLEFKDGAPSPDRVEKVYDCLDFTHALNAFLNCFQGPSIRAFCEGLESIGAKYGQVVIFGPKKPDGVAAGNWIQTVPGKGWFVLIRLYSPLQPFFDKSWRPSEIEEVSP